MTICRRTMENCAIKTAGSVWPKPSIGTVLSRAIVNCLPPAAKRPSRPASRWAARVIQLHYEVSDREVVQLVRESPYLQYFLGMETFSDEMPFSARTVARFRARIPDKVVRPAVRLLRSFV